MSGLDGRSAHAYQIFREVCVVLQVIVVPLIMQREVGTCFYLLHLLLEPQCPLVEALRPQVVGAINEDFALLSLQRVTRHRCTTLAYDESCIIGNYLNACVKAL